MRWSPIDVDTTGETRHGREGAQCFFGGLRGSFEHAEEVCATPIQEGVTFVGRCGLYRRGYITNVEVDYWGLVPTDLKKVNET